MHYPAPSDFYNETVGLTPCGGDFTIARVLLLLSWLAMQISTAPAAAPPPANELRVYVITIGPGDKAWEKFGHNLLRIQNGPENIDVAFNWGVFDFKNNFIWHFIQGQLRYWSNADETDDVVQFYTGHDRRITLQELNLSPAQRQALWQYCVWNIRKENREYDYDYFKDNCSTRVRDVLDLVLGGQIKAKASTMPSDLTFRSETSRLLADDWVLYIALNFILGQPIDEKLTAWDEMYVPMRMHDRLNQLTITNPAGNEIPLVKNEVILNPSTRPPERQSPPNRVAWFFLAGVLIGGAELYLARRDTRRGKLAFATISIFWTLLAGIAGSLLLYAWFFTYHVAARRNENVLQLSPFMLPLVVLIPLLLRGRKMPAKIALGLAGLALATSILGVLAKVLPAMSQVNANMIALALPANAGLFFALWQLAKRKGILA